jgi:hypothetical protein
MIGLIPGVVGLCPRLRVRLRLVPVFDPSEDFSPDWGDYPESWDKIPVRRSIGPDNTTSGIKWRRRENYA